MVSIMKVLGDLKAKKYSLEHAIFLAGCEKKYFKPIEITIKT
jgi:hypothetical protein